MSFDININEVSSKTELSTKYFELKRKVEEEGYEMTLEDQKLVVDWLRVDREEKFVLNQKPVKAVKEPKVKKPKKLTKKALGEILMKQQSGEILTEEEQASLTYTLELQNV